MTEITGTTGKMAPAVERFVLHWGEMGTIWGTNRSVGQIHALLYLSDRPLTAEELAETLGLARSNVSNSLKELTGWGLIRRVHVMGDRRDHFAAETELWEMVTRIAEGRKARELDPTMAMLKACVAEANADRAVGAAARQRITAMHDFVSALDGWAAQMRAVPPAKLNLLLRLGAAIVRYIPARGASKSSPGRGSGGTEQPP